MFKYKNYLVYFFIKYFLKTNTIFWNYFGYDNYRNIPMLKDLDFEMKNVGLGGHASKKTHYFGSL